MNFEERIDRLTERHEALTQSVELILNAQSKNEILLAEVIDSIQRLERIAYAHERRISHLEEGQK